MIWDWKQSHISIRPGRTLKQSETLDRVWIELEQSETWDMSWTVWGLGDNMSLTYERVDTLNQNEMWKKLNNEKAQIHWVNRWYNILYLNGIQAKYECPSNIDINLFVAKCKKKMKGVFNGENLWLISELDLESLNHECFYF